MKKCLLLMLSLIIFNINSVLAQAENELNIGAKLGVNLNQLSQSGMHLGANAGGFVLYNLAEKIGLQGELLYNAVGGLKNDYELTQTNPAQTLTHISRSVTFHNAEIVAGAKYLLGSTDEAFKPKIFLGASYGFTAAAFEKRDLVSTTDIAGGALSARVGPDYENVGDTYEMHQFAAHFGVGIDYMMSNGKIFTIEARYRRGLNDLSNYQALPHVGDAFPNTISINFGLGLF